MTKLFLKLFSFIESVGEPPKVTYNSQLNSFPSPSPPLSLQFSNLSLYILMKSADLLVLEYTQITKTLRVNNYRFCRPRWRMAIWRILNNKLYPSAIYTYLGTLLFSIRARIIYSVVRVKLLVLYFLFRPNGFFWIS